LTLTYPALSSVSIAYFSISFLMISPFGIKDYWYRLSLGDLSNKDKYIGEPENWKYCESVLKKVLKKLRVKYVEVKDEAAFYGPKIDIQFKNVYGREESMSTIQLDFAAKSRFDLYYIDEKGNKNDGVFVIHRAPLSTHERFIASLIEIYGGKFPLWLAPEQVRIVTISDKSDKYVNKVVSQLKENRIRVEADKRSESISKKVREAQIQYVPLIVTIGDKEAKSGTLAVRTLDGKVKFGVKVDNFITEILDNIDKKKIKIEI